jgi:23S rRNA (cytosine1962-C5)-methyltransferase
MTPSAIVHPRGAERARRGHPWIYRSDLVEVDAQGGDVVEVFGTGRRKIGEALYSDRSQIALRLLTRGGRRADSDLLRERLDAAIALRERLQIDSNGYRLVHGEGDLLPSLIVDRYGDFLVVQALSQGMDRLLAEIVAMLEERLAPSGILERNDARSRLLEGLEQRVEVVHGAVPDAAIVREGEVEYVVDLRTGQKTGLFLDQRENHSAVEAYARGRLLDCFSYDGGFALHLARRCSEAIAVDLSAAAAERIARNAARNRIANLRVEIANAFDFLRDAERVGERFDTIVLDPPAFAKSRAALARALGGYKEINLRALKILSPGGILVSCSCSHHVSEQALLAVVESAAIDAHATVSLLEKRMQSRDHPILLGVPETAYLKCLILRKL